MVTAQTAACVAATCAPTAILELLVIGALMGMLGQGARAVVGLKTMTDYANAQGVSASDLFEAARLITSLLIGSLVGLASALIYYINGGTAADISSHVLVGWAGAAYAGTDALEALISQYLSPGAPGSTAQKLKAAAPKPQAQQPAGAYTHDQAEKIVIAVLKASPQVNDQTPLSQLGYSNGQNLSDLTADINRVIIRDGYALDNSAYQGWSTVGDVVKSVQNAQRPNLGAKQ